MKFPKSKRYRSTVKFWPFNHTILRLSFLFILLLQLSTHATAQTGSIPSSSDTIPDGSYGPTISKNMALVLIAFVCVFFFIGFISIYIRHCTELRFGTALSLPSVHGGAGTSRSRREARGIDATVIATFPTFVYSSVKGHKLGKDSLECAVCLNEFEGDDTLRLLPKCSHVFHSGCIDAWLEAHCTCPVCRANLVPGESGEPDGRSGLNPLTENQVRVHVVEIDDDQQQAVRERESLDVNLLNQDRPGPRRLRSTGWRFGGMFSRSNSTGHLPVQPCESHQRFTLRLPEDVRSQLLNSNLNRARSCVPAFQRIQSSRQGYRSRSTGGSGPERSDFMVERLDRGNRSDRWTSLIMPTPFFGMGRPVGIQKTVGCGEEEVDVGERSIVRPAPA